ncbi:MAG: nucleoside deaminase [Ilumatobacteraceae bacterium]
MAVAFEEAWASWVAGNFGIGAVLIDPADWSVVSVGRNRVAQSESEPGLLSGNMTAHAEMNAFAAMRRWNAAGLHVYSTLEPCIMCISSAMLLKVAHVHYAAGDEFFDGLAELWSGHPLTNERFPATTGPLTGEHSRLAAFARFMPMSFTLQHFPGSSADRQARDEHPHLATLIDDLLADDSLDDLRTLESVDAAFETLAPRLPGWGQAPSGPPD